MKRNLAECRMLVTGASSGIGRCLAEQAARQGARLILVARSGDVLEDLAEQLRQDGLDVLAVPADVTCAKDRERMLRAAERRLGGLDVLVNNAGVGAVGPFTEASPDRLRTLMDVNFFAPVETIRLTIPLLRRSRCPMIVNISSLSGRRGVPDRTEYCASKFALTGFSESLRSELAPEGIDVLTVHPGLIVTPLEQHMIERKSALKDHRRMSVDEAVRQMLRAIKKGKRDVTIGLGAKILLLANRLVPRLVDRGMALVVRRAYGRRKDRQRQLSPAQISAEVLSASR